MGNQVFLRKKHSQLVEVQKGKLTVKLVWVVDFQLLSPAVSKIHSQNQLYNENSIVEDKTSMEQACPNSINIEDANQMEIIDQNQNSEENQERTMCVQRCHWLFSVMSLQ
jgi:hypothetical protein